LSPMREESEGRSREGGQKMKGMMSGSLYISGRVYTLSYALFDPPEKGEIGVRYWLDPKDKYDAIGVRDVAKGIIIAEDLERRWEKKIAAAVPAEASFRVERV